MKKNDLLKFKNQIVRILNVKEDQVFVIDCVNRTVPRWRNAEEFKDFAPCTREEFYSATNMKELDFGSKAIRNARNHDCIGMDSRGK